MTTVAGADLALAKMTCCPGGVCLRPDNCAAESGYPSQSPSAVQAAQLLFIAEAVSAALEEAAKVADRYLEDARYMGMGPLYLGAKGAASAIGAAIRDLKHQYRVPPGKPTTGSLRGR